MIAASNMFVKLSQEAGGLAPWAEEMKKATPEAQAIKTVCNDQELISIGIQRGIIDFKLYALWNRSAVCRRWAKAEPFIRALRARTGNDTLYHEFEEMHRWMKAESPPKRNRWWGRLF